MDLFEYIMITITRDFGYMLVESRVDRGVHSVLLPVDSFVLPYLQTSRKGYVEGLADELKAS